MGKEQLSTQKVQSSILGFFPTHGSGQYLCLVAPLVAELAEVLAEGVHLAAGADGRVVAPNAHRSDVTVLQSSDLRQRQLDARDYKSVTLSV